MSEKASKELVIEKETVPLFLKRLDKFMIFAPDKTGRITLFRELTTLEDLGLHRGKAAIPLKHFFFPETETILNYREKDGTVEIIFPQSDVKPSIILGIRPCDAQGVLLLDRVFLEDPVDPYYKERRDNSILVGLSCNEPDYSCFCTSVGGNPHSGTGLDMLWTELADKYYIEVMTEKGMKVIELASDLFSEPGPGDRKEREDARQRAVEGIARSLHTEEAVEALNRAFDSDIWDEVARKCLGCGACAFICPTCQCFDITDTKGKRTRTWDSCQFPDFTMHTSSHNPRPGKGSRIRNRVYHKFKYGVDAHGRPGCVGCGRCIEKCPVALDIIEVLEILVKRAKGEVTSK
jgi:ferredoxin